ncbi:TOM1-like protein 5 isoform X1 [Lycium barbarum]|uniref:TOM1-like protein 5 isoform X1 n=1 Tax=Lycium barbarum TaxID=112863 RepID=UPI00293E2656|nr:TOM1-like protein 5 isoform X1 [Lycium barbarum]XP_060183914.1 TOM1-like protein 5 isoform X1 [Lycium barbarum]XP_060183915.1 TOM1-like protein 5 isoform X1 [Lycium barbarum]XP_060183916.1 TOM1-like protein 5 isoform X1 [Lycium barbarum]XP_060183918.1 TOM1-like protein 5 isoform X1 [Lycium barbarum]
MAVELVNSATSDKLTEIDWTKNIEICELVARDHRQARDVVKAIKKRLGSKSPNSQLFSVNLLEMLINNIGEPVHKQVVDTGILPILVKIVKKKSDLPVREKIFLLLDAAQTSLGGASGRFPQYYTAYYELVSAGVEFPQRSLVSSEPHAPSNENENNQRDNNHVSSRCEVKYPQAEPQKVPANSILQKAAAALEVLREVLDAVDTQHPEAAKDEFTLDLVEQCSFQKQRVMHLAISSRDEKVVSQAAELNEQLDRVLKRHDALLSVGPTSTSNPHDHGQSEEEEEPDQLFRRIRKGKARLQPEDEGSQVERPFGLLGSAVPEGMLHRPLIRPVVTEQKQENDIGKTGVAIPPPPAKHAEREKFFQENKSDGSTVSGHMRGLSLHSRNASSSRSGSIDFSE